MRRSIVECLACPQCAAACTVSAEGSAARVRSGLLRCSACGDTTPVCAGFPLFSERRPDRPGPGVPDPKAVEERCFGGLERYRDFVGGKHRRPVRDLYALFQPFNEATRALLPLAGLLRHSLRPGDRVLDLACRTGWSGELLAALFPEQTIVSLWKGNTDVLGYRGFAFWLPEGERAENLEIVFTPDDASLPFGDGTFAAVHGHDVLHAADEARLAEVLRVARPAALLVFPHVHLANAEPEPYFEREGTRRRGPEIHDRFRRLDPARRAVFVMSERELFVSPGTGKLRDDAQTSHYNALVAVAPPALAGAPLGCDAFEGEGERIGDARVLLHPLCTVDLHAGSVRLDEGALDGGAGELLRRHPVQRERLSRAAGERLDRAECELLYWAGRGLTLAGIADRCGRPLAQVAGAARGLEARLLVELRPVSEAMARLQRFYAEQSWVAPRREQTVAALLQEAFARRSDRPLLHWQGDESTFRYGDAALLVKRAAGALAAAGVGRGDRVALVAGLAPESAIAFWACAWLGAVAVPLDPEWPRVRIERALRRAAPALVFAEPGRPSAGLPCVVLDDDEPASPGDRTFSAWLDAEPLEEPAALDPDDAAVLLHTSGTTREPKAVRLSHGSLFRTGLALCRAWHLEETDVLLSTGGLHAISGLRNPCVAVLHAGASLVARPARAREAGPLALADGVRRSRATVLATVPAVLRALARAGERLAPGALRSLRSLRMAASTGSALPAETAGAFERRFGAPVLNYYGLTETGGACVAQRLGDPAAGGDIGRPLDCIVRVVGPDGEPVAAGETGELRVYGENGMLGYETAEPEPSPVHDGWCHTGDLAAWTAEGTLRLAGRARDAIKTAAGDLVLPAEVEDCLRAHPAVAQVAVRGFTDAAGDERIEALVVAAGPPDPGAAEALRRHVSLDLGRSRAPDRIRFVERLPRPARGAAPREAHPGG